MCLTKEPLNFLSGKKEHTMKDCMEDFRNTQIQKLLIKEMDFSELNMCNSYDI